MGKLPSLFEILSIEASDLHKIAKKIDVAPKVLSFYNDNNTVPVGQDLEKICAYLGKSPVWLKLKLGILDSGLLPLISDSADMLSNNVHLANEREKAGFKPPEFMTSLGKLYRDDCLNVSRQMEDNSVDLVFADPPFNLNKLYPSNINDNLKKEEYIEWQEKWLTECIRVLKHGGALYVWNLPKWNTYNSYFLNKRLKFRHWIAVDIKYSLPIQGKYYPSHYSLLYYIKGDKPNTFHPDRIPMKVCPNCQTDLNDYGGYKDKMNPKGVNLSDVWFDIPPVRHVKYKRRKGANELSIKLLDRIIEASTEEGDTVFDPFGGSGTTYIVAELKNRRWVGSEIGPIDDIINRFAIINEEGKNLNNIRNNLNCLFTTKSLQYRVANGMWTPESVRNKKRVLVPELFSY